MSTQTSAPPQVSTATMAGRMIVAHYQDGRLLKGTTQDFNAEKNEFHLYEDGDESQPSTVVTIDELKAVFFVKCFEGDDAHNEKYNFDKVQGHGRKAKVTFEDGESISGFTMGYHAEKPGFFLIPADADGNNSRIFVVNGAVKNLEWIRWI